MAKQPRFAPGNGIRIVRGDLAWGLGPSPESDFVDQTFVIFPLGNSPPGSLFLGREEPAGLAGRKGAPGVPVGRCHVSAGKARFDIDERAVDPELEVGTCRPGPTAHERDLVPLAIEQAWSRRRRVGLYRPRLAVAEDPSNAAAAIDLQAERATVEIHVVMTVDQEIAVIPPVESAVGCVVAVRPILELAGAATRRSNRIRVVEPNPHLERKLTGPETRRKVCLLSVVEIKLRVFEKFPRAWNRPCDGTD